MRRRADRYPLELSVELYLEDWHERAPVQDVSSSGVFLETATELPVGASVGVAIAPEGRQLATVGRVSHVLGAGAAHELGRAPGVGIAFRTPRSLGDELFAIAIGRLIRSRRAATLSAGLHVVVADPHTRLLERMSTALSDAGFSVATAANGMDALAACLRRAPDVVLLECELPIVDGCGVVEAIARDHRLAGIPTLMMSAAPHRSGEVLACGATDFIAKPFAAHEAIERVRGLANGDARRRVAENDQVARRVVMSGSLDHLGLPALLTMFEHTRKSGRLVLTARSIPQRAPRTIVSEPAGPVSSVRSSTTTTWIELADGQIVDAGPGTALAVVLSALDWTAGSFELSVANDRCPAKPRGNPISITHALFEYARLRDEATRHQTKLAASAR